MFTEFLRVGATLAPKAGQTTGYAVIVEIAQEKRPSGYTLYTVLTDFGSMFTINQNELERWFTNDCYGEACSITGNFMYLDPFDFDLKRRFETQKEKLAEAEHKLKEMGLL